MHRVTSSVHSVQSQYLTVKGCVKEGKSTLRCEDYIPSDVRTGVTKVILDHFLNDTNRMGKNVTNIVVNNPLSQQTNYSRNRITFGYRCQNKLTYLPIDFFHNNTRLEVIDLKDNALTQIEFVFQPPQSFIHITISGNDIETLDPTSLQHLNDMLRNNNGKVDFDVNPLSCRKCGDLKYVSWIVEHTTRMENSANLTCTNENKKENAIDGKILTQVQSICNRPRTIAMWCSVGVGVLVVVLSFIFVVRKTIDSRRRKQNTSFVIKQIKEAKEGFEYAMFVSFSSKNQCMVDEQIIQPLEQELRHQIDVDRDLICIGDKHFRLGRPIVLETLRCLQMSHVALCVVTNDFCHSEYSMNEVRQACQLNKRIILMIEEDTNTDLMSDDLRKLFEMNTRIVWTYRNEQLVLKTTWNHICTCILDI